MRPSKITMAIWGILVLPVSVFSQFGLENRAHSEAAFHFEQAVRHHDASEFTQASRAYRKAVAYAPGMSDAWYNLALVQIHMGEFAEAERSLDTLFSICPMDAGAHALHGFVLYRQGEWERAVAAYNFALAEKPSKNLYLARGLAYYGSGQLHLASLDIDQVLATDPGNLRACQAKASILLAKGNHHLAIRFCNRILDREANDAAALTTRAVCRFRQGAKSRAMADFEMALAAGQMAATYLARATCRMEDGDLPGALTDAKFAMRIDPLEAEIYSLLASLEMAGDKPGPAEEYLGIALDLAPRFAGYHLQSAFIALRNSDFQKAVEEAYLAIDLGLENEEGKAFLRHVYRQMDAGRNERFAPKG